MSTIPALAIRQANDATPGTVPRIPAGNKVLASSADGGSAAWVDPATIGGIVGANAFSLTTGPFTQPAVGATVNVSVITAWMAPGQPAFVEGGGSYSIVGLVSGAVVTLLNTGTTGNAAPGVVVGTGAKVSPSGVAGAAGAGSAIPAPALVATSDIALTGIVTVDGVASNTVTGDVLATAQTAPAQNGYWTPGSGAWTRPSYYSSDATVAAALGQASAAALSGVLGKGSVWGQQSGATIAGAKVFVKLPDAAVKAAVLNVPPPVYTGTPSADTAGQTAVTAMLNAYLAQAAAQRGTTVRLAAGYDYWINGTLFCDSTQGVRIEGGGGVNRVGGSRLLTTAVSAVATGFDAFTVPAVGATVVVTVRNTTGFAVATGAPSDTVYRLGDSEAKPDYYTCTTIGSGVVTLKNLGSSSNRLPGATVPAGFLRSTETMISMRSSYGCKVDKLALITTSPAYCGYVIDFDGSVLGSDGALNRVSDFSMYGPANNTLPTLLAQVAGSPAVSLTGVIANSCDILLQFPIGGARGTATFSVSTDGGKTWESASDVTPIATAATWAFPSTSTCFGLTINFPVGTYSTTHIYSARSGIIRGIRLPQCFNCTVENGHIANLHDGVFVSSVRNEVRNLSNTAGVTGQAVYSLNSSSLRVDITPEPGSSGYGRAGVYDVNSDDSDINVQTGDLWSGGAVVYLVSCRTPTVRGVMEVAGGGGAPIYVQACTGVKVRGTYIADALIAVGPGSTTLGIDVDNVTGFSWNPKTQTGSLISGTNFSGVRYFRTGLSVQENVMLAGDTQILGRVWHPPATLILSSGSNTDIHVDGSTFEVAGPAAAFTTHGFLQYGNGQRARIRNPTAFYWTIPHQSATEVTASSRIITRSGNDVVIPPGGFAEIEYSSTDSRWHLFTHTSIEQYGTAALTAGVSAAIAAVVTAGSVIIVSQKTPGGTSLTTEYAALGTDRTTGTPGSFKITALLAAGTINTADTSTLDWRVVNP